MTGVVEFKRGIDSNEHSDIFRHFQRFMRVNESPLKLRVKREQKCEPSSILRNIQADFIFSRAYVVTRVAQSPCRKVSP